ncbi:MAG: exopolysaccharide Pel transporter PelG [Dorea sp.]|nr:exopolysaccharide Pel transporter PelG [Dorea sp.]
MAGIGVKLNSIFEKNSIVANLVGFTYSTAVTVAPMFLVILSILLMGWVLEFNSLGYVDRELFSCTVLYMFIFSLMSVSPFNAVLSKYMSDVIYEERYQDILPCYYLGLAMNLALSFLIGVPFCLWEHFVGGVKVFYVFTGFCGYISLVMAIYSMIYLSICKDYEKISLFFAIGMLEAFIVSLILRFFFRWNITEAMLFALLTGIFLIAVLEYSFVKRYFKRNSNNYRKVLGYFKKYWQLVVNNFLYIAGMYVHNFVFWNTDMKMVVADTFVCNQPYDMASCLAMFTNISATIIFIANIEMHFHEKYKAFSESVIGAKKADIENDKRQMFRQMGISLMNLARIQFIITVAIYLLCVVMLPLFGFSGLVMSIYPCLAAGYFILFLMYSAMLFLYYFNDMSGMVMATLSFFAVTFIGSIFATRLDEIWYGLGVVLGSFTGWTVTYMRLRWIEKNIDRHVFCNGNLMKRGKGERPSSKVFDRNRYMEKIAEENS